VSGLVAGLVGWLPYHCDPICDLVLDPDLCQQTIPIQTHPVAMVSFSGAGEGRGCRVGNLHTNHPPSNQFIYIKPPYKPVAALKLLVWHNVPDGVFFILESDCGVRQKQKIKYFF
jgi:hypothetical protein